MFTGAATGWGVRLVGPVRRVRLFDLGPGTLDDRLEVDAGGQRPEGTAAFAAKPGGAKRFGDLPRRVLDEQGRLQAHRHVLDDAGDASGYVELGIQPDADVAEVVVRLANPGFRHRYLSTERRRVVDRRDEGRRRAHVEAQRPDELDGRRPPVPPVGRVGPRARWASPAETELHERGTGEEHRADDERDVRGDRADGVGVGRERPDEEAQRADREPPRLAPQTTLPPVHDRQWWKPERRPSALGVACALGELAERDSAGRDGAASAPPRSITPYGVAATALTESEQRLVSVIVAGGRRPGAAGPDPDEVSTLLLPKLTAERLRRELAPFGAAVACLGALGDAHSGGLAQLVEQFAPWSRDENFARVCL